MPAQAVKQEGAQFSSNSTADSWCRDLYGLPISNSEIQVDSVTAKALLALPDALLRKITSAGTQHRSRLALTKSKRNDCSLSLALPTFEGSLQVPVLFCIVTCLRDAAPAPGKRLEGVVRARSPGSTIQPTNHPDPNDTTSSISTSSSYSGAPKPSAITFTQISGAVNVSSRSPRAPRTVPSRLERFAVISVDTASVPTKRRRHNTPSKLEIKSRNLGVNLQLDFLVQI